MDGVINIKDSKLYCCYSVPLRDELTRNGIRYEICALNPTSKLMMWVYIRNEEVNKVLANWSRR